MFTSAFTGRDALISLLLLWVSTPILGTLHCSTTHAAPHRHLGMVI